MSARQSVRRAAEALVVLLLGALAAPGAVLAHDDPIVTVRVLCAGLTDGQVDTAMGEIDDKATVFVDRPLTGQQQIKAWMVEQLAQNLRIEVVDIQPTPIPEGYSVTWTTRMFREDWRKAGVAMRQTTEQATIHNGRITRWTSSLSTELAPSVAIAAANESAPLPKMSSGPLVAGVPLSEIPLTLLGLAGVLLLIGCWVGLQLLQRARQKPVESKPLVEARRGR